ncbi:protein kilB [Actinophytocola sp.]|uniref:protein kilB n=1 Tax=Actinophytocola sp. TaxID=1872138 RepID=UPI002D519566|nr:protein kilB [Actinophytocola sp.]HYQ66172.1 protein kilB [Actinophytocola sp.]
MTGGGFALWASCIAVLGTLLGGLLTGVVQARLGRTARRETRAADRRAEALAAVTALLAAVADHRRTMWTLEDLRLSGADDDTVFAAREATHITRSAITAPLATVCILLPELGDSAEAAVQATYALRGVTDQDALEHLRFAAVVAEKQLRQAGSHVFAADCRGGG